jgi:hypothetical protein
MSGIPTVERINQLLGEVYTDDGIDIWWRARNRNLGRLTPLALFSGSDEDRGRVLAEAERLAGGAW